MNTETRPVFQVDVVALLAEAHRHLEALLTLVAAGTFLNESKVDGLIDDARARVSRFENLAARQALAMEFKPGEIYTPEG